MSKILNKSFPLDGISKYVRKELREAGISRANQFKQRIVFKMWIRILFRESPSDFIGYLETLWTNGYFDDKGIVTKKDSPKEVQDINPKTDLKDYGAYLKTKKWAKIRLLVLKRDNNKCRICEGKGLLHIHHLTYEHLFNETAHLNDLVTLCEKCHNDIHGRKGGKNTIPLSETSKVFNIVNGY